MLLCCYFNTFKPLCNRPSGIYILTGFFSLLRSRLLDVTQRSPKDSLFFWGERCVTSKRLRVFGKNVNMSANFLPYCPFLWDRCFAFFKHSEIIYARYVNVATGKSQTGRVKLNISASAGEVNGLLNGVMFIDLKKAFDTIDHEIILRKLANYGVDPNALRFFAAFLLSNRSQK